MTYRRATFWFAAVRERCVVAAAGCIEFRKKMKNFFTLEKERDMPTHSYVPIAPVAPSEILRQLAHRRALTPDPTPHTPLPTSPAPLAVSPPPSPPRRPG